MVAGMRSNDRPPPEIALNRTGEATASSAAHGRHTVARGHESSQARTDGAPMPEGRGARTSTTQVMTHCARER